MNETQADVDEEGKRKIRHAQLSSVASVTARLYGAYGRLRLFDTTPGLLLYLSRNHRSTSSLFVQKAHQPYLVRQIFQEMGERRLVSTYIVEVTKARPGILEGSAKTLVKELQKQHP